MNHVLDFKKWRYALPGRATQSVGFALDPKPVIRRFLK